MSTTTAAAAFSVLAPLLAAQDPPQIVSMTPPNGAVDVDATEVEALIVEFDQPMSTAGFSFCGGGPSYPKTTAPARWKNPRTVILPVLLEPDHDYRLGVNCPAASNFRSAKGVALVAVPWGFSTLPAKLPDPRKQRARNTQATKALADVLAERYSYYDRVVADWDKELRAHRKELTAAPTDRAWAAAAARVLAKAEDIHLSLRVGEHAIGTASRAIDPLFRDRLLGDHLRTWPAGPDALAGKTEDGIGYLGVGTWRHDLDLAPIEAVLASLMDCKAIVIDARWNAGGDETRARQIAAWFVEGDKVYAKNRYRERKGKNGFGPVLDRAITGHGGDRCFAGPIAVLTSRYAMSSNEAFVLMLRQANDCTQVGQPTYGSSGNPKPHELPNGVTVVLPSWQALRPDGTCFEGEGIAPDVVVEVDDGELETRDPILERALEILREKIGGGG